MWPDQGRRIKKTEGFHLLLGTGQSEWVQAPRHAYPALWSLQ